MLVMNRSIQDTCSVDRHRLNRLLLVFVYVWAINFVLWRRTLVSIEHVSYILENLVEKNYVSHRQYGTQRFIILEIPALLVSQRDTLIIYVTRKHPIKALFNGNYLISISIAPKIFNSNNESIYGVWNTIAGENSSSAISGYSVGSYWFEEPPSTAFDQNLTSFYTSHGACNYTEYHPTCGENTGLYFTVNNGPIILNGFYFITSPSRSARDPLTITIEGSNQNSSFLTLGTSWTLIYNGSAGLTSNPGRTTKGEVCVLQNLPTSFSSYRLLVTSKRGNETSTSYAEFVMIYNWLPIEHILLCIDNELFPTECSVREPFLFNSNISINSSSLLILMKHLRSKVEIP